MTEILNSQLIVRRRSEMGLSQRALSLKLAVSTHWVHAVEAGHHQELSLRNVRDLAEALGLDVVDLLRQPSSPREPQPDDVRVEAALASAGRLVGREELADIFGWDIRRTLAALKALEERLGSTGRRVHRLFGAAAIRAREGVLTDQETRRLAQSQLAKSGLTTREARVLREVIEGRADKEWDQNASVPDRIASGALMKQGLIKRVRGRFAVSDDVRFSLCLDQPRPGRTHRATKSPRRSS